MYANVERCVEGKVVRWYIIQDGKRFGRYPTRKMALAIANGINDRIGPTASGRRHIAGVRHVK